MDYELPTEFDVIVVGTGVVESIVAAAASRIGKRVLHVDRNNYYGGLWASFNLDAIHKLGEGSEVKNVSDGSEAENVSEGSEVKNVNEGSEAKSAFDPNLLKDGEKVVPLGNDFFNLKDFRATWQTSEKRRVIFKRAPEGDAENKDNVGRLDATEGDKAPKWTPESVMKDSRKFNIDLAPKLQFARGDFVELLISSNIARYSEYRSVSRVLTWLNHQWEVVPCSRSDVFANNKVSVIEKRMLMKLFTSLDAEEKELAGYEGRTFLAFLKDKKLTPNLIHYVLYAISGSTDETPCLEGVRNTKRFLNSLGRFGKTPFLFPMYGSGEITQAFCRLSAVFGGVYALNQPLDGLIFDGGERFAGLICGKQRIRADHLVISAENSPFAKAPAKSYISRAIFITDRSIMASEKEHLTLVMYPPEDGRNACTVIELGALTGTCPKDLYVVHLISKQTVDPVEDLQFCTIELFVGGEGKPKVLWSCFFSIPDTNDVDFGDLPENVFVCPGPDTDLDYDFSVTKAREVFSKMCPDSEFLPRAPDPEDIITEGEEAETKDTSEEAATGAGGDTKNAEAKSD